MECGKEPQWRIEPGNPAPSNDAWYWSDMEAVLCVEHYHYHLAEHERIEAEYQAEQERKRKLQAAQEAAAARKQAEIERWQQPKMF